MENSLLLQLMASDKEAYESFLADGLDNVLQVIRTHLGMDVAFVSEVTKDVVRFRCVESADGNPGFSVGDTSPVESTYCQRIIDGRLPNIIPDTLANPVSRELKVTHDLNIGSYISVPLHMADGSLFGTICCYGHKADHTLVERDLSLMKVFADFAAIHIERELSIHRRQLEITARLKALLKDENALVSVYQPIYDVYEDRIAGFESLSRFAWDPYREPNLWFTEAAEVGLGPRLEVMAIEQALKGLDELPKDTYLSLNCSAECISEGLLRPALQNIDSNRVVIEITEHSKVEDFSTFGLELDQLRRTGVRFALDDAGAGYASFNQILEMNAEIIKLDISLIRDIHLDPVRRALSAALIEFAKQVGREIVAEGVENEAQLVELKQLGVNKVQGFYIAKPMSLNEAVSWAEGRNRTH